MDERIRTINTLKNLLVCFFPEFEGVAGDIKSKSAQYLILNGYHDHRLLQEADTQRLGEELKRISRGRFCRVRRISKRGRGYLRKSLYLAALNMVRSDPDFKALYRAKKERGKNSFSALTALSKKLLRICFGLVKYGENYDSERSKTTRVKAA